jgi:aminomethyltransferase
VSLTVHDDRALLALQGPSAAKVLQSMTQQDLSKFYFGNFARFDVAGIPCWVTRTG